MAHGLALEDIHSAVKRTINKEDVEGFVGLYAQNAHMVLPDGSTITGHEAIREQVIQVCAMKGRMTVTTRYIIEAGDLAILSNKWTLTAGGESMSAITAEVAQRQPDGGWLYIIDNPYAGPAGDAGTEAPAATAAG
ncbi:conserved hypothetical protein [Geodermatophilus dictyosporus]|uniref:SnoaL-like domain-containing protein n=1 Tax=Geodermatophilus dictyosporus TaxID=1523247 RepID=A0A1I5V0F4_9ACTN|nr:nuclear transport factor 2 family protein [Geodermatophilus dictyosporus]SFQ01014.1 conserved hypothetical protein [Geodermatophilus dictyosporus]